MTQALDGRLVVVCVLTVWFPLLGEVLVLRRKVHKTYLSDQNLLWKGKNKKDELVLKYKSLVRKGITNKLKLIIYLIK